MQDLLLSTFNSLRQRRIRYCLLRDGNHLEQYEQGGEIDMLVAQSQFRQLKEALSQLGFTHIPAWGHAPHHFFFSYDRENDVWFKLDIVTEIAYGQPSHALRTKLAVNCLNNRQRQGAVYVPSPEDELVTLLLHCVLDKKQIAPHRAERLRELRQEIKNEPYISGLLTRYWANGMTWAALVSIIDSNNWSNLTAQKNAVSAYLTKNAPVRTPIRQVTDRVLRKMHRWVRLVRPTSPSVALLAPDGAGKSTLAESIHDSFHFPVHQVYMGLYQKNARTNQSSKIPGFGLLIKLGTQWWRYLTARSQQARGRLVIFDRYIYDSMLPPNRRLSRMGQMRRWLLAHACPPPDLVLFLDAPGALLYARKGEHTPAILEAQRQSYLKLQSHLPQMVVVDASADAEDVRRNVTSLIWEQYVRQLQ